MMRRGSIAALAASLCLHGAAGLDGEGGPGAIALTGSVGWIAVGTPPRHVRVQLDLGRSSLWLAAPSLKPDDAYDPTASSTYRADARRSKYSSYKYVGGADNGVYVHDNVSIAGYELKDYLFGSVTSVPKGEVLASVGYDGVLGLGLPGLESAGEVGPFNALAHLPQVLRQVVTFAMGRGNEPGELLIGRSVPGASFSYCPVTRGAYLWECHLDGVEVNGESIGIKKRVFVDTGNSNTFVGLDLVRDVYRNFGGYVDKEHGAVAPCVQMEKTTVTFHMGGMVLNVPGSSFILGRITLGAGEQLCSISLVGNRDDYSVWILGQAIFQSFYVELDWEKRQVGFASRLGSVSIQHSDEAIVV